MGKLKWCESENYLEEAAHAITTQSSLHLKSKLDLMKEVFFQEEKGVKTSRAIILPLFAVNVSEHMQNVYVEGSMH